jgi:hypothetical protein
MEATAVGFVERVRAVHQALESGAVGDGEHVAGLVRQHLEAALEEAVLRLRGLGLAPEALGVAGQRIDAHPRLEGGLAEDEVPRRVRIEIRHGDAQVADGIAGQARQQHVAHQRAGVVLGPRPHAHQTLARSVVGQRDGLFDAHAQLEEGGGEVAQLVQRRQLVLGEGADGLQDDDPALGGSPHGYPGDVLGKGLARLGVAGQPIVRGRLALMLEELRVEGEGILRSRRCLRHQRRRADHQQTKRPVHGAPDNRAPGRFQATWPGRPSSVPARPGRPVLPCCGWPASPR